MLNQEQFKELELVAKMPLSIHMRDNINKYISLILLKNQEMNLIGKSTEKDLFKRHICDCIQLAPFLFKSENVIDLGSGSGMPGLLMAIILPSINFTLVEKSALKSLFLREVVESLNLENVIIENVILCDIKSRLINYDTCISRAFKPLNFILNSFPKKSSTRFVLLKGKAVHEEIKKAVSVNQFQYEIKESCVSKEGCILELVKKNTY